MRARVLVVDDEKAYADVLAEFLADEGFSVSRAYDGLTALQMLQSTQFSPDAVICDVMLPGLRGDRLASEVRRLIPHRKLPIILMSASDDPRVNLRDVSFLNKPVDCGVLVDRLDQVIQRRVSVATL
jgi:DNA-binding response OmpR family regulator